MTGILTCIDLDHPLPGYRQFISAWLYRDDTVCYVVDCGPSSTIEIVVDALAQEGVERLDAVLLTHIHLDHGGGVGDLVTRVPVDRVVCHPRGAPHLVDPERLWRGSLLTLGEVAEVFGPPSPVDEGLIVTDTSAVPNLDVETIDTPGHAPHHVCYIHGTRIYLGEVAGTHLDTPAGPFLRPATPPRFLYDIADASIARVQGRVAQLSELVYGHYGTSSVDIAGYLTAARWQLAHWLISVADQGLIEPPTDAAMDAWVTDTARTDPLFAPYLTIDADMLEREKTFIAHTIGGFIEYLAGKPDLTPARERANAGPPPLGRS